MKYFVNDGCIGCGLCAGTCPDVFSMSDDGVAVAIDSVVPEELWILPPRQGKLPRQCHRRGIRGIPHAHECRSTVLETKCFPDLQEQYLADPKSGPCPFFKPGDTFLLKRTPQQDDFYT